MFNKVESFVEAMHQTDLFKKKNKKLIILACNCIWLAPPRSYNILLIKTPNSRNANQFLHKIYEIHNIVNILL